MLQFQIKIIHTLVNRFNGQGHYLIKKKRTYSKHQMLTEEKLVIGFNILLENLVGALRRRLGFKVSGFKFVLCQKELQCMNVNCSQRCKECPYNNRPFLASPMIWAYFMCDLLACWPVDCAVV
jgi:hypothetical protein